jgi:hypothetical protein
VQRERSEKETKSGEEGEGKGKEKDKEQERVWIRLTVTKQQRCTFTGRQWRPIYSFRCRALRLVGREGARS